MNIKILVFISAFLSLTGCANSVNYYHSERASIALEAKASDPQAPLQGNIGIKVRTVLVAPGSKSENTAVIPGMANGESVSAISDFKLKRSPGKLFKFGETNIKSSFITGNAAIAAPAESMKAITGLGYDNIGEISVVREKTLRTVYQMLEELEKGKDKKAIEHKALLDQLAKLLPEQKDLDPIAYYVPVNPVKSTSDLKLASKKISIQRDDFLDVIEYEKLLREYEQTITNTEEDRSYTLNGATINKNQLKAMKAAKEALKLKRKEFASSIGNSNQIDSAAAYVMSTL